MGTTRRELLGQAAAAAVTVAIGSVAGAVNEPSADLESAASRIRSVVPSQHTLYRYGGDASVGQYTWTIDDRQIGTTADGPGWPDMPADHYKTACMLAMRGNSPKDATFEELLRYPDTRMWDVINRAHPAYYGSSTLAVEDQIYHYLGALSLSSGERAKCKRNVDCWPAAQNAVKLIYSPDNGSSWLSQDGSSPVVLEAWDRIDANTMAFVETDGAFASPTFLQMGKGYRDNTDGYVYVYGSNGMIEGSMNQLVMFRAPKGKIRDRTSYEYFVERNSEGQAS